MSLTVGRESHATSCRFLLDVGSHTISGSGWILSASPGVRFLLDLGYHACCARFWFAAVRFC